MSKINEINIKINKAIITDVSFKLNMDEEKPLTVNVSGELIASTGKVVSTFNFYSDGWLDEQKFEVPVSMHAIAQEVFEMLTPIIYEKINGTFKALPAGKKEKLVF